VDKQELTPVDRAAIVLTWLLADDEKLKTADVACRLGMSQRGARGLLCRISLHAPIYQNGTLWQALGR